MLMGQSIVGMCRARSGARSGARIGRVPGSWRICIEGMHGADGAGHHKRYVIGRPPERQRVIRRASERLQVQFGPLLLHPQRHQLLLQVVSHGDGRGRDGRAGRASLRREASMAPPLLQEHHLVPLVAFVVESGERQNVKEEQRGADRYSHTELGGVVADQLRERRLAWALRTFRIDVCFGRVRGDYRGLSRAG